jgi:hypothetical protein
MGARPYSALFVTHDVGLYGAPRSLQTFLSRFDTRSAELMVNRRVFGRNDLEALRRRFGPFVSTVREAWLPFDMCFDGQPPHTLKLRARNALAALGRSALLRRIEAQAYDFIHLNALVLHPLIDERLPFILHVREIYDGRDPAVPAAVRKARAAIFIDEATYAPFRAAGIAGTVINNPFDMSDLDPAAGERLLRLWEVRGETLFVLIGKLNDNKGAAFVVEAFAQAGNPRAKLVLVGEGDPRYVERCKALAAGHANIVFHGFEHDVNAVYAAADYVVRGEEYACIGRTIYEGLYAGCEVVVPGTARDAEGMFEAARFGRRVHTYMPRSVTELTALFRDLPKPRRELSGARSNVDTYLQAFDDVLAQAL